MMSDFDVPSLETARLFVRPFMMEDLTGAHRILDVELREADFGTDKMLTLAQRLEWLKWAVLNYQQLAILHQPPYGDRAIVLKLNGELIGVCGFVPCLNAFEQLPGFAPDGLEGKPSLYTTEFGLFYAISPAYQHQGYATEAAQALVEYAFQKLHLKRIIAETNYDNLGSMGVMRKLGMQIEKNPLSGPPWLQVVGMLENI
jgi:[ribosomal protein S5]-alanine N-acetyltransferase